MNFYQTLEWRYATKKMDPSKSVSADQLERILDAVNLAPSSSGLQPYEVIVVSNADLRRKMLPIARNQSQVVDGSHVLVFAAWDNYTADRINTVFDRTNQERGFTSEAGDNYRKMLLAAYPARSADENFQHAARQACIALGFALMAAANEQVDCTPMEGFDNQALDELLGLPAKGLKSVAILPLGHRDTQGDWLVNLKKVRKPKDELTTVIA
jgi:nitroreductase